MRSRTAFAAALIVTIGLLACGKYGPPVRSVPPESRSRRPAIEREPQVPEEKIPEPADFDDAQTGEEQIDEEQVP
jgi:hypothetical protein